MRKHFLLFTLLFTMFFGCVKNLQAQSVTQVQNFSDFVTALENTPDNGSLTIVLEDDIEIPDGSSLEINNKNISIEDDGTPRTISTSNAQSAIFILKGNASLSISGTEADKIIFSSSEKKTSVVASSDNIAKNVTLSNLSVSGFKNAVLLDKNVSDKNSLKIDGCKFSENDVAVNIIRTDCEVNNSDFTKNLNNNSSGVGAIFIVKNSSAHIKNSNFTENTGGAEGSAIHFTTNNQDILTLDNANFSENTGTSGTAIYCYNSAANGKIFILNNSNFAKNSCTSYGGALYVENLDSLIVKNSTFKENTALAGGALYLKKEVNLLMDSTDVLQNTSTIRAGGIYTDNSILNINSSKINYNNALHGGGIYANNAVLNIDSSFINENRATNYGGGIYSVNDNTINIRSSKIDKNYGGNHGGGIYALSSSIDIKSSFINENTANSYGGGIYANNAVLNIDSSFINENTSNHSGGGIYANNAILVIDSSIINENRATYYGGGIYSVNDSTINIRSSKIDKNYGGYYGGGIYASSSSIDIKSSSLNENRTLYYGGGLYASSTTCIIDSSNINNNRATTQGLGGGVYSNYSNINIHSSTVNENYASWYGGGTYQMSSKINIISSHIDKNETPFFGYGGGLYITSTDNIINIDSSTINENKSFRGGGIYCSVTDTFKIANKLYLHNSELAKNTVQDYVYNDTTTYVGVGGGAYLALRPVDTVFISKSLISENTAPFCGGMYIGNMTFIMDSTEVSYNEATSSAGGGIYFLSNNINILSAHIKNNKAYTHGGGLYFAQGKTGFIKRALIRNNTARLQGGGFWGCPTGISSQFAFDGAAVFDNQATGAGDDVVFQQPRVTGNVPAENYVYGFLHDRMLGGFANHYYNDGELEILEGTEENIPLAVVEECHRYEEGDEELTDIYKLRYANESSLVLKNIISDEAKAHAEKYATIIIEDNYANNSGGGVASNGGTVIGSDSVREIAVQKFWQGAQPDEYCTVYLFQTDEKDGNETLIDSILVKNENNYAASFQNLPHGYHDFQNQYQKFSYSVKEKETPDWTSEVEKISENEHLTSFNITNTSTICICDESIEYQGFEYKIASLGKQCWFAQNLRSEFYDDENQTPVPDFTPYLSKRYNDAAQNTDNFGYLYSWKSAIALNDDGSYVIAPATDSKIQGICPEGWYLPDDEALWYLTTLSNDELKSLNLWSEPGSNESGFNAVPSGLFNSESNRFEGIHSAAYLWGVSESGEPKVFIINNFCNEEKLSNPNNKHSVRCVKVCE